MSSTRRGLLSLQPGLSTAQAQEGLAPDEHGYLIVTPGKLVPPEGHHYDMAKGEVVVVQIMGMGPVVTTSIPQPDSQ